MRAEVENLSKAHDRAGAFLEWPAVPFAETAASLAASPQEQAGDKIGPYRLLEAIGEGGCGIVYLAEQEQPLRRRVALKVINLGMDTKVVIARLPAEVQWSLAAGADYDDLMLWLAYREARTLLKRQ